MGVATIIFTVHTDRQGRLVWVDLDPILSPILIPGWLSHRHDEVVQNMQMQGKIFIKKYENQVMEMMQLFLEYMKFIWVWTEQKAKVKLYSDMGLGENPTDEIKLTPVGYPMIPNCVHKRLLKAWCEKLFRTFLAQHYCQWIPSELHPSPSLTLFERSGIWKDKSLRSIFIFAQTPPHLFQVNTGHLEVFSRTQETCTLIISYRHFSISTNDKTSWVPRPPSSLHFL